MNLEATGDQTTILLIPLKIQTGNLIRGNQFYGKDKEQAEGNIRKNKISFQYQKLISYAYNKHRYTHLQS